MGQELVPPLLLAQPPRMRLTTRKDDQRNECKKKLYTLILQIVAILTIAVLMTASTLTNQVFALKRYFNCMTDLANKSGKLTLDDVNSCYDKEFHSSGSQGSLIHSSLLILQILASQLPITRY
jgi:hypothetical protein